MTSFIDRVVVHASAGDGGDGCASVHREKFKPLGGPDGGNGGSGGDVVLLVDSQAHTLLDFHHHPHQRAGSGRAGQGGHRDGAAGQSLTLAVPDGTVVHGEDGAVLIDLVGAGTTYVLAHGGRGGLGNAALSSTKRKAPGFALLGEPGEAVDAVLELKSVADVGLVGYPSAGKSSLVSVLSAARPKIADYPFTTLVPHLGVISAGETVFTMADVPGLIPGAAQGRGLGLEFLRHIERCAVLVHVVDAATAEPGRDPMADIAALEHELAEYGGLADRPRVVVLNKIDLPDGRAMAELVRADAQARGWPVFAVSAVTHEGLRELTYALGEIVAAHRAALPQAAPTRIVLRPVAVDDKGFTVTPDPDTEGGFWVRGIRPERWVRQTDFGNDEAVGYLGDRLARLGVEEQLARAGAVAGDPVRIGDVVFDWEPTVLAGVDVTPSLRGTDARLEPSARARADERRQAKRDRHSEAVTQARGVPDSSVSDGE